MEDKLIYFDCKTMFVKISGSSPILL
uniref:Uncharacterized protein n=1 Tax=Rhizophora mucronata TaxID=61149 RepID=A0A2P2PJH0_RHIMU